MFANERYEYILNLLENKHFLTVSELMQAFGVSFETVRRDLAYLEKKSMLTRVHGGAVELNNKMPEFSALNVREVKNQDLKYELSKRAAELVEENEIIALDAGSTANEFIKALCETHTMLTIVTYSKDIIDYASANSNFKLICVGGEYLTSERFYKGYIAEENLLRFNVSKSFIFPASVSVKFGLSVNLAELYGLQRTLLQICQKSYALADSSKLETVAPIKVLNINEIGTIVTDSHANEITLKHYKEHRIDIIA